METFNKCNREKFIFMLNVGFIFVVAICFWAKNEKL